MNPMTHLRHDPKKNNLNLNYMSENDLLELAEDCKNRIIGKNKQIKKLKNKLVECRKDFLFSYSEVRNIDMIIHDNIEMLLIPEEIMELITTLRGKLSELMDDYLLADVGGYDSD